MLVILSYYQVITTNYFGRREKYAILRFKFDKYFSISRCPRQEQRTRTGQANRPEPTLGLSLGSGLEKSSAECDARREENEEGNGGCGGEEGGPYVAEHFLLKRRGTV